MKKVILASVLAISAVSVQAAATQVYCSGTAGNGTPSATSSVTTENYVKSAFTPKCSANTHVSGEDGGAYYRVGSGSIKGKTRYAGTSAGGAVVAAGPCSAASGCVASDATTAMTSSFAPTS